MRPSEIRHPTDPVRPRTSACRVVSVFLLVVLLGVGCTLTRKMSWISSENPFANDAASADRGRVVYAAECASCHGPAGLGDGPAGESLAIRPTNLRAYAGRVAQGLFAAQVAYGKDKNPDMPRFVERLSREQIWDVTSFIYSMAPSAESAE